MKKQAGITDFVGIKTLSLRLTNIPWVEFLKAILGIRYLVAIDFSLGT